MSPPRTAGGAEPVRHPDFGRLIRDETADTVICHVCGRDFRSLGAHVRVHGLTAAEYREEFGLLRTRPLSARSLSQERSGSRRDRYSASKELRGHLAAGRAMARSGELTRRRRSGTAEDGTRDELRRVRRETLDAGRRTRTRDAEARLTDALRAGGFTDVGQALRVVYVEGDRSIEETAAVLAVGKNRLQQLLTEHGIGIRPAGRNSGAGRRARVLLNDRAAAERVGARDITVWLRGRAAAGATLRELAEATGRSVPWVAARIGRR
ncbi:MucR family transcriptional regulator [Streptomyces sp. SID13726]|uniref:MucR family transcriptional regulator n=1 Tax=Streptomyces sp. SID13726 TaxID=2706058 RepID=UPI0013BD9762|nr:MucR family transcriptional regulator [Streptomyces sp. SID13726]NEA99323.1 MucR family transcriptional regulator [Streptomyces sp. SID13726]